MPTEQTPDEIAAIRARHEAATPGPYMWDVRPEVHSVDLKTVNAPGWHVLQARRWGMRGAQMWFRDLVRGVMVDMKDLLVAMPGREHHKWIRGIDHPDAIALEKSWEDRLALLAHADALAEKVARLEGERDEMHEVLVESCDMARCPQCLKWVDSVDIATNGDGCDFDPVCADCFDEATHHCVDCDFRTSTPKEFETCPTCGGEIARRDQMCGDTQT